MLFRSASTTKRTKADDDDGEATKKLALQSSNKTEESNYDDDGFYGEIWNAMPEQPVIDFPKLKGSDSSSDSNYEPGFENGEE